jgi:hypothetical protein
VVAHCFGLSAALEVCAGQEGVIGAALVVPPLFPELVHTALPLGRRLVRQARGRLGRLRRLPLRAAYRLRYGPSTFSLASWASGYEVYEAESRQELVDLVRLAPTWILVGEHDLAVEPTQRLLPELHAAGDVEFETVAGLKLRSVPTPEAQAVIRRRVRTWARDVVARHAESVTR